MLSDLTNEEFEYCRAALALAQAMGLEKPPGEISALALAEWYCTNPSDLKNEELAAIEKLRNLLHV